jgi:hypothetical protein
MKTAVHVVWVSLALASCGGGDDPARGTDVLPERSSSQALPPEMAEARQARGEAVLVARPAVVVNSTLAGHQSLQAVGATGDGSYIVAWVSGPTFLTQHFDSSGHKVGGETAVPISIDTAADPAFVAINSAVAVLADGGVVMAYPVVRHFPQPNGTVLSESGIYMQRFDASGVQVVAETQLASRVEQVHSRSSFFSEPRALALADGGYVLGWTYFTDSAVAGTRTTYYNQRFDSQNQPVGPTVIVGEAGAVGNTYRLVADANGGYTVYSFQIDFDNYPRDLVTVTHYDAGQVARQIVAPRAGGAVLLPLKSGSYILFATDSEGHAYRQMLDAVGNPAGEPSPVDALPISAHELADGSHVVFWSSGPAVMVQRFESSGAPMGDVLAMPTQGGVPRAIALPDGGFASAWSAPGAQGDLDVYAQLFAMEAENRRKACLADAKGLRGRERKAFMDACMR